jgi:hypothetical protein
VSGQSSRLAPGSSPYSLLTRSSCGWKRSDAPAQCTVLPPTVLQIQAGRFGKSLATCQLPEVVRLSSQDSCRKAFHSSLSKLSMS